MSSLDGKTELKVLQLYEEKLLSVLVKEDLGCLSESLYEMIVISKEVKDKFVSLDHGSLTNEQMVRYLLQHVYDAVKDNKLVLYSFLDVLDGIDEGVAGELRREVHKYELAEVVGESKSSQRGVSVCMKRSRASLEDYRVLCEEDVPKLTELLANGSDKSEELGLSLGLNKSQIIQCQKGCSNIIALFNILLEWIRSSTEPCTVNRLKKALSSNLVALNNMVSQLEEHFLDQKRNQVSKQPCIDSEVHFAHFSGDVTTVIAESAFLASQATSTNQMRHQWRKNGHPPSDNEGYFGIQNAGSFIGGVRGHSDRQYECRATRDSCFLNNIEKMTVAHSKLKVYSKYFSSIYSIKREIPKDSWPPVTTDKYINLAMISKHKQKNNDYAYAVVGDMDDIIEAKEKVEFDEVFGQYNSGALILVEGRPGSGKTTLMHKVTRDWALKGNILVNAEIVILVPIRLFGTNNSEISLSDIFEIYIENDSKRCKLLEVIEDNMGEGVCFIIDGLDEYEYHNNYDTVLLKLISKHFLPLSMVIVASRPVGTASVRGEAPVTKRIEVLGFKNSQILEYVISYYKEDQIVVSNLISYLKVHINVYRMCYLPVHAAMICFLYSKLGENIPQTETKIYESFTRFTLLRKLNRDDPQNQRINSLQCLTGDVEEYFSNICKLAFDMIMHSKQTILQSQTQFPLSTPRSDKSSLGLVTIDSTAELFGLEDLYTFLHLTFQEYLAAFYLAGLEDENQVISKTKERQANLQMVWKFYCGMVQFKAHSLVLNYIMANTDQDMLYKIQCAFESQQQIVCDSVLELDKADTLSFKDHSLIPTDFLAISYVISSTHYLVTTLTFTDCSLDEVGVALFLEKMRSDHLENIKYLGYHHKQNRLVSQFKTLNMLLRKLSSLETLDFQGTELGVLGVQKLTEGAKLPNLSTLKIQVPLKKNYIDDAKVLKLLNCNSLKLEKIHYLCPISKSYLESYGYVNTLAKAFGNLQFINSRHQLISCINFTFKAESQSSKAYFQMCSKLVLINCGINDDLLNVLVESMTICTELDTLHLDFNRITSKGAALLSNFLEKCEKLKVFSAHCNEIDDSGALAIANALVH